MEKQWNYLKIKNKVINDTHMYMVRTITRLANVMKTCWQKREKSNVPQWSSSTNDTSKEVQCLDSKVWVFKWRSKP
jgi:hypothetical protein